MLRKKLPILLIFYLLLCLCRCSSDKPVIDDEADEEAKVELSPSDIQDFNKIYKPNEFKDMNWLHKESDWSFFRSKQSKNFIVFWEKGFGEDPNSFNVPESYRVDVGDLLKKAESFFKINVEKLEFAELGENSSNLDKYKMQIYLFYQNDWIFSKINQSTKRSCGELLNLYKKA